MDPSYVSPCDVNETVSCQAVYLSSYGMAFGVPVAAGGAIWSALVLLLATLGLGSPDRDRASAAAGYTFVMSVVGLAAVFYFAYASVRRHWRGLPALHHDVRHGARGVSRGEPPSEPDVDGVAGTAVTRHARGILASACGDTGDPVAGRLWHLDRVFPR